MPRAPQKDKKAKPKITKKRESSKAFIKKETPKKEAVLDKIEKADKYWEAAGRRKTAVARVRLLTKGGSEFLVNGKPYQQYFPTLELRQIVEDALSKMNVADRFRVLVKVKGGGIHAQAEAVRHGISRALVKFNENFKKRLRKAGFLTRDSRMRERKKFGLKRARKAPQWKKR